MHLIAVLFVAAVWSCTGKEMSQSRAQGKTMEQVRIEAERTRFRERVVETQPVARLVHERDAGAVFASLYRVK